MNKTNDRISPDVIAVDIEKLSAILSCGCATARKIGEQVSSSFKPLILLDFLKPIISSEVI